MSKHVVAKVSELPPGTRRLVTVKGRPIVVFNVNGLDVYPCAMNGKPLDASKLTGTAMGAIKCAGARLSVYVADRSWHELTQPSEFSPVALERGTAKAKQSNRP